MPCTGGQAVLSRQFYVEWVPLTKLFEVLGEPVAYG